MATMYSTTRPLMLLTKLKAEKTIVQLFFAFQLREDSAPKEFQAEVSATNVEIGFARYQLRAKIVRKKT